MNQWGLTWEDYKVTTEDGYILTMFRLTGSEEDGPFKVDKPPVLIAHGLSADAIKWMMTVKMMDEDHTPFQI